jgi:hypothetical protein
VPSPWEVPAPISLNTWKHHAGALRHQIAVISREGEPALAQLPARLRLIGTDLMDLYTGVLPPAAIATRILAFLKSEGKPDPAAYRAWLEENRGFRSLALTDDTSCWVLRLGVQGDRYVHVHPGRWTPLTQRVRANVLKTAIMLLAHIGVHGGDPRDIELINRVRSHYLQLSPIKALAAEQGLGLIIDLLRSE